MRYLIGVFGACSACPVHSLDFAASSALPWISGACSSTKCTYTFIQNYRSHQTIHLRIAQKHANWCFLSELIALIIYRFAHACCNCEALLDGLFHFYYTIVFTTISC